MKSTKAILPCPSATGVLNIFVPSLVPYFSVSGNFFVNKQKLKYNTFLLL